MTFQIIKYVHYTMPLLLLFHLDHIYEGYIQDFYVCYFNYCKFKKPHLHHKNKIGTKCIVKVRRIFTYIVQINK